MTKENQGGSNKTDFESAFEKELKERIADFEKPDCDYGTTFNKKDAFAAIGLLAISFVFVMAVMIFWGI